MFAALTGCSKCGGGPAEPGAPISTHASDAPVAAPDARASAAATVAAAPAYDPAKLSAPPGCKRADPVMHLVGDHLEDTTDIALYKLDPQMLGLRRIGPVECWPFSIAVERNGTVWGLGDNEKLYTFGPDASCHKLSYVIEQHDFGHFHIAFAAGNAGDKAEKSGETLFASDERRDRDSDNAPSEDDEPRESRGLGRLDRDKLTLSVDGTYLRGGEPNANPCSIAGTGDGRLFALCPGGELTEVELRRDAGAPKVGVPLRKIDVEGSAWPHPAQTRPIAFWGGAIWLFAQPCDLTSPCDGKGSPVIRVDVATRRATRYTDLPIVVRAAGASTCAPVNVP